MREKYLESALTTFMYMGAKHAEKQEIMAVFPPNRRFYPQKARLFPCIRPKKIY